MGVNRRHARVRLSYSDVMPIAPALGTMLAAGTPVVYTPNTTNLLYAPEPVTGRWSYGSPVMGDEWSLSEDLSYPWREYAGVWVDGVYGIPNRTTIYRSLGVPGQASTYAQSVTEADINGAIASCPSGQVVYLYPGTYSLGQITFGVKSGVTLRGAGPGQTIINSTVTRAIVTSDLLCYPAEGVALASGYEKGSMSIVLGSAPSALFTVGNLVSVYQDDSPNLWGTGIGVYHRTGITTPWQWGSGRYLRFITRITSVDGNTIGLATPLPIGLSAGLNPSASPLRSGPGASLCGVEDMTVIGNGTTDRITHYSGADRCWAKNIEADNIVGTTGMFYAQESSQCEVRRCFAHDTPDYPINADGYPWMIYYGCGCCRFEDNVAHRTGAANINGASGNVQAYNYMRNIRRRRVTGAEQPWITQSMIVNHGPHATMNLVEGNMIARFQNDGYHGSTSHTVVFRNQVHGLCPDLPSPNRIRAVDLCRGAYYHTVVGNVIGDPSWSPTYYDFPLGATSQFCVYILGFPGMDSVSMSEFTTVPWDEWAKSTSQPDADVAATVTRHGNYDYYNNATVWADGLSHSLPASLLYDSVPDYFGPLNWPPIGPDVSGLVTDIPAKMRWDNYAASGDISDMFDDEPWL